MRKINIDRLDMVSFLNGLVFYAPVALLVRTNAGVTMTQFLCCRRFCHSQFFCLRCRREW